MEVDLCNSTVSIEPANKQCEHKWVHCCWLSTGQEVECCLPCGSVRCGSQEGQR